MWGPTEKFCRGLIRGGRRGLIGGPIGGLMGRRGDSMGAYGVAGQAANMEQTEGPSGSMGSFFGTLGGSPTAGLLGELTRGAYRVVVFLVSLVLCPTAFTFESVSPCSSRGFSS